MIDSKFIAWHKMDRMRSVSICFDYELDATFCSRAFLHRIQNKNPRDIIV